MEYVIWGVPPGASDEQVLYTKATTLESARRMINVLESDHGCSKMRIQTIDLSRDDVQAMFRRSVKV